MQRISFVSSPYTAFLYVINFIYISFLSDKELSWVFPFRWHSSFWYRTATCRSMWKLHVSMETVWELYNIHSKLQKSVIIWAYIYIYIYIYKHTHIYLHIKITGFEGLINQAKWDLRFSVILPSVDWKFVTDVSEQPFGLILKSRSLLGLLDPWKWDR
jgi:hypothetical protein